MLERFGVSPQRKPCADSTGSKQLPHLFILSEDELFGGGLVPFMNIEMPAQRLAAIGGSKSATAM